MASDVERQRPRELAHVLEEPGEVAIRGDQHLRAEADRVEHRRVLRDQLAHEVAQLAQPGGRAVAPLPDIAHPVIYLRGEEGTAKSTAAILLRRLVDPSTVEKRRQPGRDEDFEITLAGQWGIVLDNLSSISEWLSDAICTAVTGVGDIKRKKYADQELSVLQFRRCFILTSIPPLMDRGDLVDRTCAFDLLPVGKRKTDTEIEAEWTRVWPEALGALLDLASRVLSVLPEVADSGQHRDYRLADFALIAAAMDQAVGTRALRCYADKVAEGVRAAIDQDPFAAHLVRLAAEDWTGTAGMLFDTYKAKLRFAGADLWPKNPIAMGMKIRRIIGVLRKFGVTAHHEKGRKANTWHIYKTEQYPAGTEDTVDTQ